MKQFKGELKGFPEEVVERMLQCQVEQGNKRDVRVFERCAVESYINGGFDWHETKEGFDFWFTVILDKNFDHFFERYPKTKPIDSLTEMLDVIGDDIEAMRYLKQCLVAEGNLEAAAIVRGKEPKGEWKMATDAVNKFHDTTGKFIKAIESNLLTPEKKAAYLRIGLQIQDIDVSEKTAKIIIETYEGILEKGGQFTLEDAMNIKHRNQ